jgi:hypothetical protein
MGTTSAGDHHQDFCAPTPTLESPDPGAPAPDATDAAPPPALLGARALDCGAVELAAGVREQPMGTHSGKRIALYFADCVRDFPMPDGTIERRRLGITAGNWCAAFVSWCAKQAAREGEAIPHAYRASVAELWKDAVASSAARPPSYRPRAGDLAIYKRSGVDPTKGGIGHVGRVAVAPDADGKYETIEGNHGGAVARVQHTFGDTVGWVAYPDAAQANEEAVAVPTEAVTLQIVDAIRQQLGEALQDTAWLLDLAAAMEGTPRPGG